MKPCGDCVLVDLESDSPWERVESKTGRKSEISPTLAGPRRQADGIVCRSRGLFLANLSVELVTTEW